MSFRYVSQGKVRTLDTFGPVAGKSSLPKSEILLPGFDGVIHVIRIHTASPVKFSAGLFESNTSVRNDVNNIFLVQDAEQTLQLTNQGIWFLNEDDPITPKIWFDFENDSNGSSGLITLHLTIGTIGKGKPYVTIPQQP